MLGIDPSSPSSEISWGGRVFWLELQVSKILIWNTLYYIMYKLYCITVIPTVFGPRFFNQWLFFPSLNWWSTEDLKYTMVNWPWQIGISMMILTLLPRVNAKWVMLATTVTALRSIAESLGHLKFSAFQKFQFLNFFKESQK